ncbi:cobalamin-dependent protein [Micromonospora haikouensis]|uniref:cobalamin-dependent protein n=1 Tax=Micromonospora haikouensis TaxID=686309 RepID=UPI0037A6D50E
MDTTRHLVILGVAGSDAHAVANHLIAMHLREHGFDVVNLGVCTPLTEFADAVDAHPEAEAVIIGSLNGHAYADLRDLPALRAAGRLARPVILGGNLSVGSHKADDVHDRLRALGVDHILENPYELPLVLDLLRASAPGAARRAKKRNARSRAGTRAAHLQGTGTRAAHQGTGTRAAGQRESRTAVGSRG